MKVTAIIQARMGSSRLPGKVLMPAAGRPLLQHQIERVRHSRRTSRIVVATTLKPEDEPIVEFCRVFSVECFRGSELDVLGRFHDCARTLGLEAVARLTADNPLQEPEIMDQVLGAFLDSGVDYASNTITPTWLDGVDVEVFSAAALARAWREARTPAEREHVTPYLKNHPELFRLLSLTNPSDHSHIRCTVDRQEDYAFVRGIIEALDHIRPYFTHADILEHLGRPAHC